MRNDEEGKESHGTYPNPNPSTYREIPKTATVSEMWKASWVAAMPELYALLAKEMEKVAAASYTCGETLQKRATRGSAARSVECRGIQRTSQVTAHLLAFDQLYGFSGSFSSQSTMTIELSDERPESGMMVALSTSWGMADPSSRPRRGGGGGSVRWWKEGKEEGQKRRRKQREG